MAAKADVEVAEIQLGVGDVDARPLHALVMALDVVLGNDTVVRASDQVHADAFVRDGLIALRDVGRGVLPVVVAVEPLPTVVVELELSPPDELDQVGASVDRERWHGCGRVMRHLQGPDGGVVSTERE